MIDRYENTSAGLESPALDAFSITPNDATDLQEVTRALYIGSGGNVTVTTKGGAQVTFAGLTSGSLLPIRAVRVHATGTTASVIVGLI